MSLANMLTKFHQPLAVILNDAFHCLIDKIAKNSTLAQEQLVVHQLFGRDFTKREQAL